MATPRGTQVLPVLTAAALAVALTGCAPAAAPAETAAAAETTASATPAPETTTQDAPATALTREYLDAIAQGDYETSWSLLSDESQAFYGTVDTYSSNYELDGTVTAAEAAELGEGELTESEGPEGAFTLVNGSTDTIADAWIVRETDAGLRIDDSGVGCAPDRGVHVLVDQSVGRRGGPDRPRRLRAQHAAVDQVRRSRSRRRPLAGGLAHDDLGLAGR
jgi:hypothetical protein